MAAPGCGSRSIGMGQIPEMTAYQVRSQIEQTAQDLMAKGWDAKTGYGLLNIEKALTEPYKQDRFEPNDLVESGCIAADSYAGKAEP